MKIWLVLIFLCVATGAHAQDEELNFGDTETTNFKPTYKAKKGKKNKRPIQWIKNDTEGLLLGNLCMTEVTEAMGFEYLIQVKGNPDYKDEFGRLIHNFGAKIGIMFRNGPFWKFKLKKERKNCRESTGDYMG